MTSELSLRTLPPDVKDALPSTLRAFRTAGGFALVKLYYGNRDIHYEAWHRPRLGVVEIGLHFESDDLTNARLLGAFQARQRAIHKALPAARIEAWDKGWARIWEPVTCERLDGTLRDDLARLLAAYIATLEPILRDALPADLPWSA